MNTSRTAVVALALLCVVLGATTAFSLFHARAIEARLRSNAPATLTPAAAATDDSASPSPAVPASATGDDAALLAENVRLREQVAALAEDRAGMTNWPAAPPVANTNRLSYMERLQRDDPERYKQIVAQREQRRKQMEQWYQDQLAALDQRAQTAPTKEEVDLATQISDTLAKIQQLRESWRAVRDLPEDQRDAAIEQLRTEQRDAYQTLNDLRERDRQFQLQQLAAQVGYRDAGSMAQFADAVQQIYKNTEYSPPRGGRGDGSGGGGSPGPRP